MGVDNCVMLVFGVEITYEDVMRIGSELEIEEVIDMLWEAVDNKFTETYPDLYIGHAYPWMNACETEASYFIGFSGNGIEERMDVEWIIATYSKVDKLQNCLADFNIKFETPKIIAFPHII